jgi:hypothetical protein
VDDKAAIDELILAERIIPAIKDIMAELGCSLRESLDEFQRRYDRLRTRTTARLCAATRPIRTQFLLVSQQRS